MAEEQPQSSASDTPSDTDVIAAAAPSDTPSDTPAAAPGDTVDRVAELERRVAELERQVEQERDQATDYMRRWHTAQADFANYKRRQQQDQQQRERLLAAQALAPVLNALDSLERAFIALPASLRSFSWIEGIALVELQLSRALELAGIQAVAAEPGQPFDPARHEPIGEVESEQHAEGSIAMVAQRGYESNGLLIRPALVQLARKPKPATESAASMAANQASGDSTDATDATDTTETPS